MSPALVEPSMWDRMIFALIVSVAVHFLLVLVIQGRPTHADYTSGAALTARLEPLESIRAPAPVPEPDEAVQPLPVADRSAASETRPEPEAGASSSSAPQAAPKPAAETLDIPVIRDPTYYAARFLDEYPKPLGPVQPRYPEQATIDRIGGGSVTLLLLIDEEGVLRDISVVEAKPEAIFNEAAIAAFRDMRFSPARKDGRAVRSRVLVTVGFESNDRSSAR
jgi:protein TonB